MLNTSTKSVKPSPIVPDDFMGYVDNQYVQYVNGLGYFELLLSGFIWILYTAHKTPLVVHRI
jgi:hypothetical protein